MIRWIDLTVVSLLAICLKFVKLAPQKTFGAVYTQCSEDSGVQQADAGLDIFRKTTFGLLQSQSAFDNVIQCVDAKTDTLENSDDAVEWFIGHLFDKERVQEHIGPLVDIYDPESTCAQTWGEKIALCLGNMTNLLYTMKPSITSMYAESICSITLPTFGSCQYVMGMETDSSCSYDDLMWMMQMGNFFAGLCEYSMGHSTSSYGTASTHSVSTYDWFNTDSSSPKNMFYSNNTDEMLEDWPEDGILSCTDLGPDILFLFPPSEVSDPILMHMSFIEAVEKHTQVFNTFCSMVDEFSECVTDMVRSPSTPAEENLASMINHYQVSAAFTYYCSQMSVITPQFGCTMSSLSFEQCHGGFQNIMSFTYDHHVDEKELCRRYKTAEKCQVEKQLNTCDKNYGHVMSSFYKMLLSQKCIELNAHDNYNNGFGDPDKDGNYRDFDYDDLTEPGLTVCYGTIATQLQTVMEMVPQSEDETDPTKIFISGMRGMCSMRRQIMSCVYNVQRTSHHPYDTLLFEVIMPDNMDVITEYMCDHVDEFERHSLCMMMSLYHRINGDLGCLGQMQRQFEMLQNRLDQVESMADMRATIPVLCRSLDILPDCMYEIASTCSAKIGKTMETLGRMIQESCNSKMIVSGSEMIQHSFLALLISSCISLLSF